MKRLIDRGLMFGNLVRVDSPALVDRYNRALKKLTGRVTTETEFHIDISGFSPEVGEELGDPRYLNPNGVNRQFILLSPEQKTAPLLNATFSTERAILRRFIDANLAELFSLTARDAVVGELEDAVYDLDTPARLLDLHHLNLVADTTGEHLAEAGRLAGLITRFRTEPEGWHDDRVIAEMIALARSAGDLARAPVMLRETAFATPDFWTTHFGGCYLFRSVARPVLITMGDRLALGAMPVTTLGHEQRNEIARFLQDNALAEPVVRARGAEGGAILRQKMDFILVDAAAALGIETGTAARRELRAVAQRLGADLPPEFHALAALLSWAEAGGAWPQIDSGHPGYFYTLRATQGPLRDLVNMLLAELAPKDVRQLFICHKELFYRLYATWPEAKRAYVAQMLEREYQIDKAGARARLFGPEPGMEEPPPLPEAHRDPGPWGRSTAPATAPAREALDLVGPWGAVRRAPR